MRRLSGAHLPIRLSCAASEERDAAAEEQRREMEVQLVDEPLFDALAHDRPTAGYHDVAFPRRGGDSRLVDGATQVVDESDLETQLSLQPCLLLRRSMGDHEVGLRTGWGGAIGHVIRPDTGGVDDVEEPPTHDNRTGGSGGLLEYLGIHGILLHHPRLEPVHLAISAEASDVAVERHGDVPDHLDHPVHATGALRALGARHCGTAVEEHSPWPTHLYFAHAARMAVAFSMASATSAAPKLELVPVVSHAVEPCQRPLVCLCGEPVGVIGESPVSSGSVENTDRNMATQWLEDAERHIEYELGALGFAMRANLHTWKVIEGTRISRDNDPPGRSRRCCDQEVVGPSWLASALDGCEKTRMLLSNAQVVRDDRQ